MTTTHRPPIVRRLWRLMLATREGGCNVRAFRNPAGGGNPLAQEAP